MSLSAIVATISTVFAVGAVVALFIQATRAATVRAHLTDREQQMTAMRDDLAKARDASVQLGHERERLAGMIEAERAANAERVAFWEGAQNQLKESFSAASHEALAQNNIVFLDLAETKLTDFQRTAQTDLETRQKSIDALVQPVAVSLKAVGDRLEIFDKERTADHATIQEHLRHVAVSQVQLAGETQSLVRALRAPQVRGQWGELQLQRVVELAGMMEHCDFVQQETVQTDNGRLRPDLVVRLPGAKIVVVDSKAPLAAYLDAMEATDDVQRGALLDQHAKQVRDHIVALSAKDYANQFAEAPDFVVMFLPGESFFSAACQRDPNLIDFAIQRGVIPASPTTLITVLKAVNYGWQQERIGKSAEEIRDLGQTLYERVRVAAEHLTKIRKGLEAAVTGYNGAVGAFESRVLPTARKFRDLGAASGDEIQMLEPIAAIPRLPAAEEMVETQPIEALDSRLGDQ